jgi:methionyl-tRNA formyltransferase
METSALTLFEVGEGLDDGPIFSQQAFPLTGTLSQILTRIELLAGDAVLAALRAIEYDRYATTPQQPTDEPLRRRRTPSMARLHLARDSAKLTGRQLRDHIRAQQYPYPTAYLKAADGEIVPITLAPERGGEVFEPYEGKV